MISQSQLGAGMTSMRSRKRLIDKLRKDGITDQRVLNAMESIPRHLFLPAALQSRAYENSALPIGSGQTISQPLTVGIMTQLLLDVDIEVNSVLEIGTGSGYQAAVLSRCVPKVYTVERIASLLQRSRNLLYDLRLRNLEYKHDDGFNGWLDFAPFDGILVTASISDVPLSLIEQLRPGARMILPVGENIQMLKMIERTQDSYEEHEICPVKFVSFLRGTE